MSNNTLDHHTRHIVDFVMDTNNVYRENIGNEMDDSYRVHHRL